MTLRSGTALRATGTGEVWRATADQQTGVITRSQLLDDGYTPAQVAAMLNTGRWTRLHPGVYATYTGPIPPIARNWAAVLAAGPGAALGGRTALWLWGAADAPPSRTTVCIPWERRALAVPGTRIMRRRGLAELVHPAATPPRLRIEQALLDVTHSADDEAEVVDLVIRTLAARLTTPERVDRALQIRNRFRHRRLLTGLLDDAVDGVHSSLEHRYKHDVERPHGLPRAGRNRAEPVANRRQYRDVRYRRWNVVVELDGRLAHPLWLQHRDRRRDNEVVLSGGRALRFGWHEVVDDPCGCAAVVAAALRAQGWDGAPTACGPGCRLPR